MLCAVIPQRKKEFFEMEEVTIYTDQKLGGEL